jgi:ribose transport system permease protein
VQHNDVNHSDIEPVAEGVASANVAASAAARPALAARIKSGLFAFLSVPAYPTLVLLLATSAFIQSTALSLPFIYLVLRQAAPLGLLALGQRFPVIGRSLDLSVGGNIALINVVLAMGAVASAPAWVSIALPITIGIVIGLVNGLIVARLRVSAVIVTLGTSMLLLGLSLVASGGAPGGEVNGFVRWLGSGRVNGFPVAAMVWFGAAALMVLYVQRTTFFRTLEATGTSYKAARLAGLSADSSLIGSYVTSGVMAALSGIVLTGYIGTGTVDLGSDLVLASVAAVILGGSSFGLSRGGFFGCVAGVLVIIYLGNLLTILGFPEPMKQIVQGIVVVTAASLSVRQR